MKKGIDIMQRDGWVVKNTEIINGEYKAGKTCLLGVIFLPLALLGKSGREYKVQYSGTKLLNIPKEHNDMFISKGVSFQEFILIIIWSIIIFGVIAIVYILSEIL
jgi:hypothetical protein